MSKIFRVFFYTEAKISCKFGDSGKGHFLLNISVSVFATVQCSEWCPGWTAGTDRLAWELLVRLSLTASSASPAGNYIVNINYTQTTLFLLQHQLEVGFQTNT